MFRKESRSMRNVALNLGDGQGAKTKRMGRGISVRVLVSAALALGMASVSPVAGADDYPTRDIHAICTSAAGSGGDLFARFFSEKLSALAGKPVIVDNKAGALGTLGVTAAAQAKPDGYTILVTPASATMAAAMSGFKKLPYDPVKDFVPVTTLARLSFVIVVDPKTPIKSIADLTDHLKAKGNKAAFGTANNTGLISGELYKKYAGLPGVAKVQYKEPQTGLNDMYAGNLDFMCVDGPWAMEQAKSGRLRILAVTSDDRLSVLPDVPTMDEAGVKGFGDVSPWWAVFVPAKTPQPIVAKLEAWFNQIVASGDTKKWLNNVGSDPFPGNSQKLAKLLSLDIKRWGEYYKLANLEPQ
jgi:tripartite-type tricarboxylate transporter receptor subunit TctC